MHAWVFVGRAEDDVRLAVELPVIVPLEAVGDDRMEPCKRVRLVELACVEVDEEDEALAAAIVVWKMAIVPLRVEVVVYDR